MSRSAIMGLGGGLAAIMAAHNLFLTSRIVRASSRQAGALRATEGQAGQGVQKPASVDAAAAGHVAPKPLAAPVRPGSPSTAPVSEVRVHADARIAATGSAATGDLQSVCGLAQPSDSILPWDRWCSLAGTRIPAASSSDALGTYAARVPDGAAVLVVNHGAQACSVRLAVRTLRGVYTVERLTGGFASDAPAPRVERLDSAVLGRAGDLVADARLDAGEAAVFRMVNRSGEVQRRFDEMLHAVRALRAQHGRAYHRLMTPVNECADNVAALAGGIQPDDRYECLRHVHRALLTLAHAEALADYLRGAAIPAERAAELSGSMARLESALGELSAACLGLVPHVDVTAGTDAAHRQVVVSLRNGGRSSLSFVKIGADAGPGCEIEPVDQALFTNLRPGEIVRATYAVRLGPEAGAGAIAADYAWMAAKVPAHLRLRVLAPRSAGRDAGESHRAAAGSIQ